MGFGASTLDFSVRAWTHDFDRWISIRSDMMTRMVDARCGRLISRSRFRNVICAQRVG